MPTLVRLDGLDVAEVTMALIPLISGDPADHGLRPVAVSDVDGGQAIEITFQDATGSRRRFRVPQVVEVVDTWPFHYRDDGRWCSHSGRPRGARRSCPCHEPA